MPLSDHATDLLTPPSGIGSTDFSLFPDACMFARAGSGLPDLDRDRDTAVIGQRLISPTCRPFSIDAEKSGSALSLE